MATTTPPAPPVPISSIPPTPISSSVTLVWGQPLAEILAAVSSPVAMTVAFLYQQYAPVIVQAFESPSSLHDLVASEFAKIETVVRGGALTVNVHSEVVANILTYATKMVPGALESFVAAADPWIQEELQFYGIIPKPSELPKISTVAR